MKERGVYEKISGNNGRRIPPYHFVEYFDEVTYSFFHEGQKITRVARVVPKGFRKQFRIDICETEPLGMVLLEKEEGMEFKFNILQRRTVIIQSISKSPWSKYRAS